MEQVDVVLDNRYAFITADYSVYEQLRDYWSFTVPGAIFMPKVRDGSWDGKIRLLSRNRLPAGLFRATYTEAAEKCEVVFRIRREPIEVEFLPGQPVTDPKYAFQFECVEKMCTATPLGGGIILAATSAGKTKICVDYAERAHDLRILFVVDQLNLLYQAQKEFADRMKCKIGIVGDSEFDPSRVTIATVQTLNAHCRKAAFKSWLQSLDVVIVDELHEQMAKRNFNVLHTIEPLATFGLTATLELGKKEIRYKAFAFAGPIIFQYSVAEGMKSGVLNQGAVLQLVFDEVDWKSEDHWEEYDIQVIENNVKHEAARMITEHLVSKGRHVVQMVARLNHLDTLREKMLPLKYATMWGGAKKERRERAVDRFEAGKIPLLIANQVMKKGVSINIIDVIIDMAERKSPNDAVQKFGRGVRRSDTGTPLFYVDFATRNHDVVRSNGRVRKDELSRAAKARVRAFKAIHVPVRRIAIHSAEDALHAVKVMLKMFSVPEKL